MSRPHYFAVMSAVLAGALAPQVVAAQTPTPAPAPEAGQGSAVRSAADAFGERVGTEQLGLYNEGEVRGFNLQSSGAYRIDDAYFVRAAPLPDPVLAGVGVRVGVNASRLAYPSPSGVVNYRLREPTAEDRVQASFGWRDFATPFLDLAGSWTDADGKLGVAADVVLRPEVAWGAGNSGEAYDAGLVARWRPSAQTTLRGFASFARRDYDGDYGALTTEAALPPVLQAGVDYSPAWARAKNDQVNLGVLLDAELAGWSLDASAFRSVWSAERSDFTLVKSAGDGTATATLMLSPEKENVSDSVEARAARAFTRGGFDHLVSASLRGRRSRVELVPTLAVDAGAFVLPDAPPASTPPPPGWDDGRRGEDAVEQVTASLGYGLAWGERLQLRLGAHRSRYDKQVTALDGGRAGRVQANWFYNASAVWSLTERTSLFGSWVTGLEETGTAPATASNRNEVLAPVEAVQKEVGVRHRLGRDLILLAAVFDVAKPTTGFRDDGSFGLVGEVRHRGVEASLAGKLDDATSIVLGAVAFEPEVTGPLVDAGRVGPRPAGVSEVVANFSVERRLDFLPGWSVDAQVSRWSERWVDTRNTLQTPPVTLLNLGARKQLDLAGTPAQFRVLVSNVADERGWWGSPSQIVWPIGPRTVRASLTMTWQ